MNKKPPVKLPPMPFKTMSAPVAKKPVKPIVSPSAPPAPVWQRLDLPINTGFFQTNQFSAHAGAIVSVFDASGVPLLQKTYGKGLVSIVPPVGEWQEQVSNDGGVNYVNTAVRINQVQAGANNTTSVNLTLNGLPGPAKLMRYLLNQESL